LRALGIDRIVLRSLVGMAGAVPPVEFLRCLASLDIPIECNSISDDVVAPWLRPGWNGDTGPFGHVDMSAWKEALKGLRSRQEMEPVQ